MKHKLLNKLLTLTLFILGGALFSPAWGKDVLTLDCATPAPTGTTSTTLSTSDIATFLNSAAGLTNKITCSSKTGDVYKGKGSGGGNIPQGCLKIGKASGGGGFTFTIPDTYDKIDEVELTCYGWKTTSSISINNGTAQTFTTAQSETTKTFELASSTRTITIAVTTSAVCVTEIVLKSKTTTYSVTYNANGGSGDMTDSNSPYEAGAEVTLLSNTFTAPTGKTWSSWAVTDGSSNPVTVTDGKFTMPSSNVTVTAQWVDAPASDYITASPTTTNIDAAGDDAEFTITTDQTLDVNPTQFYTTSEGNETTSKPTWITDVLYDDGTLLLTVAENTGVARTAYFRVEKGSVKSDVITISQAGVPVETPSFSPVAGIYTSAQSVTISSETEEATIYYTTNGDTPTTSSTPYSSAINVGETMTIKAIAVKEGYTNSAVAEAAYTINIPVVDYVTLPFAWEGGSSSSLTSTPGVTASGLGSDYAQTHDPYNVKFDNTNDYIQIKTNERPEYVTVGIKMVGGNSDSKITVQESADGETYTKVGNDLSISGAQNTILSLTSTTAFASTTRYIRLSFTKGSNVGIGPITVTKYVPKYTITIGNPTGGTITVKDSKENLVSSGNKFEENAVLTLSAEASTGYTFSNWTKTAGTFGSDATTADNTFTMPAVEATIGATFTKNSYTLSLSESSSGTFTVKVDNETWDGESKIPYNSNVSITANPNSGKTFASWDTTLESYDATTNPLIFNMPAGDVEIEASFADASIEYGIVVDDDVTGGNIEADVEKAKAGDTVTLTATPSSGYVFDSWNVQDESENTVTVTNNQFTMPASDVTVTATFLPVYTVNYYIGGVKNTTTRISGEALNLDTPSTGFAGWSTANSATSPVFMANDAAVTSNLDVYAIFISSYSVEYHLVEADQADWRGDYLIAYSSTIFADGRVGKHDGTYPIGGAGVNVNPADKLSGKIVDVEWGDTYNVTLEAIDNSDLSHGYVMKGKDNYYIYQTSNTNGITSSANKATAANYPITVTYTSSSDVKLCLGGSAAGAVFRYNENGYFRYYKNGGQSDVYLYKRTLTANYSLDVHETVTVGTTGYATYASDHNLDFTKTNIKAYIATTRGNGTGVAFTQINKVPAGTGVLLYVDDGETEAIPVFDPAKEDADGTDGNKFVRGTGGTVATDDGINYNYILNNGVNGIGFYRANNKKVAVNRAYICIPKDEIAAADAKDFFSMPGFDDDPTGINDLADKTGNERNEIYNLAGQRINKLQKGINIINGKKIMK